MSVDLPTPVPPHKPDKQRALFQPAQLFFKVLDPPSEFLALFFRQGKERS